MLQFEFGDQRAGTPWAISFPIFNSCSPNPLTTAPDVSPPAVIKIPKVWFKSLFDNFSKILSILFANTSCPYWICFSLTIFGSADE